MATATGWGALPISLSFGDSIKNLVAELNGPVAKAAKNAGGSIEKEIGDAAKNAADRYEKQQWRMEKATKEKTAAEENHRLKLLEQQRAQTALENAEKDLAEAREAGGKKARDAQLRYEAAQIKVEKATIATRKASDKLKDAQEESAKAAKKLEDQLEELEHAERNAADEAEDSRSIFKRLGDSMREAANDADDMGGKFRGGLGLGAVAGVAASLTSEVVGSFSDLVAGATEASDATDKFKSTLDFAGLDTSTIEQVTAQAQKYADQTVYDLGDIQNMTAQLAANGVDNYTGLAEAAGNLNAIAGGNADTFKSVGMVMSQTAGAGKLTTENWNQLADAIPGASGKVQEALEQAGAYTGNFRDAMAEGQITAEEFNDAVMQLGNEPVAVEAAKSTQTFEGMLGNLQATIQGGLANAFTELKPYIETFVNGLSGLAEKYLPVMVEGIKDGIEKLKTFGEWVQKNRDWLEPLGVALGVMAGGLAAVSAATTAWTTATRVYSTVQKIATGELKLFNLALKTNVIGLVVTAVAALVAGLIYFFTKTETGREMWEKFTEVLGKSIDWIGEKWNQLTGWLSDGWITIKTGVIDAWNAYWLQVQTSFAIVTGALNTAWTWLKDTLVNVWATIRDAVFVAFEWYINRVKANFELVTGALSAAWTWLKDMLVSVWNTIRDAVFTAFNNAIENVRNIFDNVTGAISGAWTWLKDQLHAGWLWIDENVFDAIGRGLDQVKGWFESAVDGITSIWDKIRAAAAKPVKFVVDTVFNNGIRKAWNAVAKFVGLDELSKVELGDLGNFASGGILPGYTPGRDPYTFIEPTTGMRIGLSGGEAIVRPEATRVLGSDWVDGINAAAKTGGAAGVQKFLGGFANGGIVESISAAVRKHFPMMTITSTYRNTNDHHGAGRAVDFSNGTDSTPQMRAAAQWFYANYGPGLLELIHSPFNDNVKDGANVGDGFGFYGAGTMNQHRNHVHVAAPAPLGDPSVMVEMIEDAGGSGFSLSGMVKGLWDKAIGAVGKWTGGGLIGSLPGAMLSTLASSAWDFVSSRVGKFFGAGGTAGNAESWREMAMAAMRRQGFNADDPAQVNAMLAQIASESGGDPNIAQQIVDVNGTGESAGVGLLQIIPGTFEAYRDPELPNDRRDPWANMNAALRYYRARYGTDLTTMWGKGHGYADGGVVDLPKLFDNGGVWRDGTMGVNLSGSDEVVFNNRQWQLLKQVLNTVPMLTDSQEMMVKEIGAAFLGGDVGYAELANALGSEKLAQQVTDIAFLMGQVSRDTEVMAAAAEFNEQARKSAEDYAAEQAGGFLSIFGLEGLVPLAQKAGGMAWDAYVANPVDVAMTPGGVTAYARKQGVHAEVDRGGATVTIEAESDDDLIRVSQFKQLASQVDWLKVKVERKPKAAVRTRGGVM